MKEIKPGYYSSVPKMVAKLNAKIKMEGLELALQLWFKENEILREPTPISSPFMTNMERYTALYVYTDIIQNQLVGDVRAPLLRVVPVNNLSFFLWTDPTSRPWKSI